MSEDSKKDEEVFDDKLYHEHPLILRVGAGSEEYTQCSGCRRFIFSEEAAYRCRLQNDCNWSPSVHEECAEMPREMKLSIHPQHTLIQKRARAYENCAFCDSSMSRIGYCCSDDSCEFQIHVGCAQNTDVMHAAAGGDRSCIDHRSHPQHRLTLLGRSASLRCDACGTIHKGNSYLCIECQYCINEGCAALPETTTFPHHDHPLSLAYHLPQEYIKFRCWCDICYKDFQPKYWLYHCRDCRYAVHINCAIKPSPSTKIKIDGGGLVAFPMERNKAVEKLIVPFVMKNKLGDIPMDEAGKKYKFHYHDHELSLISSSSSSSLDQPQPQPQPEKENENSDDDDDDNDDFNGIKPELVCDGCTLPIHHKQQLVSSSSSSSSSSSNVVLDDYYMSCSECKYFLHWACFHLPPELPSHPLHLEQPDHNLTLEATPKLEITYCRVCEKYTNGLFYFCKKCGFKLDILCASLPGTIKHTAHPQHQLKLLTREITTNHSYFFRFCSACDKDTVVDVCYRCEICRILLHASCVLLPPEVRNRTWDKHPLPLTTDASRNHPSGIYCDICETEMHPKMWMYHCRKCDFSFHPRCFPAASGEYQNIMFGQRYAVAAEVHHHHTLVYQLLTTKLRCDVCKRRRYYGSRGFQCDSHKCDFFMCLNPCGNKHIKKPLDCDRAGPENPRAHRRKKKRATIFLSRELSTSFTY